MHHLLRLRVVMFEDPPGRWVAQALEYDIKAEGPSQEAAVEMLLRTLEAQVQFDCRHNREPLARFCAAPHRFWTAFARATPIDTQWFHINPAPNMPGQVVAAIAHARLPASDVAAGRAPKRGGGVASGATARRSFRM